MKNTVDYDDLNRFKEYLFICEKSVKTIEKYIRDCLKFVGFVDGTPLTKETVIAYKQHLVEQGYSVRSVNSMVVAVNCFLAFLGFGSCRVKVLKLQKQTYLEQEKELTKTEYMNLLSACGKNTQLKMILQTICGTGIRVSELKYITVDAVRQGKATVNCKSKNRIILIPVKLQRLLNVYIKEAKIKKGPIFVTKTGAPLDRSYIWRKMKKLCCKAGVKKEKVFPHNLRKLFARTFYTIEKDIAKLADVLGHSNIETTRIYIMTSFVEHRRKIDKLGLII
ncbi:MAG: tyrosine-type recombinase/integrase [Oscillospiraceae bacterium]|nr:tyrosine-type recombinase/integrase [Oscillospiraceae bacterium]